MPEILNSVMHFLRFHILFIGKIGKKGKKIGKIQEKCKKLYFFVLFYKFIYIL